MIRADVHGRVAIITGAGSGIGFETARLFAANGASLLLNDIDPKRSDALLSACRDAPTTASESPSATDYVFVAADAGEAAVPEALVSAAIARFGRIDYLINNAATSGTREPIPFDNFDSLTDEFWHHLLDINLLGPFRMTKAASSWLRRSGGAVVNTASTAGLAGPASSIPYAASKAGLINLTRNLARALAPEVRVNAVAPGFVDSGWTAAWPEERRRAAAENTLLRRTAKPRDIAEAIFFLCVGAGFVNAQTLVVDGGRTF